MKVKHIAVCTCLGNIILKDASRDTIDFHLKVNPIDCLVFSAGYKKWRNPHTKQLFEERKKSKL